MDAIPIVDLVVDMGCAAMLFYICVRLIGERGRRKRDKG